MRILFALPGFHRFDRGAEVALLALANQLALSGDEVTVIGAGQARPGTAYHFIHSGAVAREKLEWLPNLPFFRDDTQWEDASFALGLARRYRPEDFDISVTCAFPFTNFVLRGKGGAKAPRHVFVTQNGDWPAYAQNSEYRWFGCDGLVCINPDYFERNQHNWSCALIPNGIDVNRFQPGPPDRARFGLPPNGPVALMVSACIASKRVLDGIDAVSRVPGLHLVVAGDGPMRDEVDSKAAALLPGRFTRLTVKADEMPALYRSADLFLHMSRDESFGNVYIEAMGCGLPIVAHDQPRMRWIAGDGQLLVDTGDLDAVARALQSALAGGGAREAGVVRAREFRWENIAVQYREFFTSLLKAGPQ